MNIINTKVRGSDDIAMFRHFETANGECFYNIGASYDAKLDMANGIAYPISSSEYSNVNFPTVNDLMADGVLIEVNENIIVNL